MREALETAERGLAALRATDSAQVTVTVERSLLYRFARSRPTQATAVDDENVELTVVRDGHVASARTNNKDEEALTACARSAERAAEAAAWRGSGPFPGLPGPSPPAAHDGHDPETARLDPLPARMALCAAFDVAAVAGVEAHGVWSASEVETAIVSTTGTSATDRLSDAFMKVVCLAPGGRSGYAAEAAVGLGALDARALAERSARKAAASGEATRLPRGEYPVVLERHAVADLLTWLGRTAFDGLAYAEGRSALEGRLGRRVAGPGVNLSDSPRYPGTLPRAFDAEGVPKGPLVLIQDGVAHRLTHDTRSAALAGAASTGHALAPGGSPWGALPTNLVLAGGGAADEADLCSPVERGIYVTRLWYTNAVRSKEALITGVTRDGTFLIEDGRPSRPLADMRFTDGALDILAAAQDTTARAALTSEGRFYGRRFASGVVCPALRAGTMRFTA